MSQYVFKIQQKCHKFNKNLFNLDKEGQCFSSYELLLVCMICGFIISLIDVTALKRLPMSCSFQPNNACGWTLSTASTRIGKFPPTADGNATFAYLVSPSSLFDEDNCP